MSRLTRNGTAENPSRETKFSGTYGDRGIFIFPVQLTTISRIGNLARLIHTLLYVMAIHIYYNKGEIERRVNALLRSGYATSTSPYNDMMGKSIIMRLVLFQAIIDE